MIQGMLDQDIYKLTMQQAVCQLYPYDQAQYEFIDRGCMEWPKGFDVALRREIETMSRLKLAVEEENYLAEMCPYLTPVYRDFLRGYRFNPDEVSVGMKDGKLRVDVSGPWYRTILWEVPLLATISELYYKYVGWEISMSKCDLNRRSREKALGLADIGIKFAEFGTRRRLSYDNQWEVLAKMLKYAEDACVGSSNVHMAMLNNQPPVGTQAHEWFMFHAAKYGYPMANRMALGRWVDVYDGSLGIALTDTFGTPNFFQSFGTLYAKLFDGIRQDSGDPIQFAMDAIRHYNMCGVDPTTKTAVFSDALDSLAKIQSIHDVCKGKIRDSYGIGTWLTNDVDAPTKLNIVMKMTGAKPKGMKWKPTVKLSDDVGKHTGEPQEVELCKCTLGII